MFLLVDERASFTNAEEKCRQRNASLAIFKNNEELGYVHAFVAVNSAFKMFVRRIFLNRNNY